MSLKSKLRALLVLGRVSNLPTLWSNGLAGWSIGTSAQARAPLDCDRLRDFCWLLLSMTLIYTGGMFLNDAFDAQFDRVHRQSRPIPSGAISEREVWFWGFFWLAAGTAALVWFAGASWIVALSLASFILIYDAAHKSLGIAPWLMGVCRFLVYLAAGSAAGAITGYCLWAASALALYVAGLSYFAKKEPLTAPLPYWPAFLLAAPILLALVVNNGPRRAAAWLLALIPAVWILRALRIAFRPAGANTGLAVARLLAGICLVDMLALADLTTVCAALCAVCFLLALGLQRSIPAT